MYAPANAPARRTTPTPPAPDPGCGCDAPLDLSQPDLRDPDRLLGVCTGCGMWFQVNCYLGRIVPVPDPM